MRLKSPLKSVWVYLPIILMSVSIETSHLVYWLISNQYLNFFTETTDVNHRNVELEVVGFR